jgi:RNA polymerase sigma-70 factor, ECF subfamily
VYIFVDAAPPADRASSLVCRSVSMSAESMASSSDIDESALVARVQRGETAAYATLVERHLPRALRVAWRVLRHREEAEDAVQDAFLRALERIEQYDPSRPFSPWFFRIVVTTAINRQRSSPRDGAIVRWRSQ